VLYELALLYKEEKVKVDSGFNNLKMAVELAEKAVSAFPNSSGSSYAQSLLQQIRALSLQVSIRGFNVPGQSIDILYQSKNLDSIYLNVFRLTLQQAEHLNLQSSVNYHRFLKKETPIKTWVTIPQLLTTTECNWLRIALKV
jgi:hypothetical protein